MAVTLAVALALLPAFSTGPARRVTMTGRSIGHGDATESGAGTGAHTGATGVLAVSTPALRTLKVRTFPVPTASSGPAGIAAGPDGALWFAEQRTNKIGRITTKGKFTEYRIPNNAIGTGNSGPTYIVRSGKGVWFLTDLGQSAYRMTPNGKYKPYYRQESYPASNLAPSRSGGVWLMMNLVNDALILLNPNGTVKTYPATDPDILSAIALAPGGAAWYNDEGNSLNSLNAAGQERSYPVSAEPADQISSIAFSRSGTAYYTAFSPGTNLVPSCCGAVGFVTRSGTSHFTQIGVRTNGEGFLPHSLILGPGGNLWFAISSDGALSFNGIARINPSTQRLTVASTGGYVPAAIAFGKDGALWFTDSIHNLIARIPSSELSF